MTHDAPDPLHDPADDWLDAALRTNARESAYIADAGFTAKVMGALPAPAVVPAWRKPALGLLWAAGLVAGAVALPEAYADVAREAFRLVSQPFSLPQAGVAIAALGAAMWTAAAWTLRDD
jgi:hypothetical protein